MKKLKNLSILLIVFVSIFCVACDKKNTNSNINNPNTCVVTFIVDNTVYETQTIEKGSKVTEPEDPTKLGYEFKGWFVNDEEWSFIGYVVTDNITIKAKMDIITYTATFKADEEVVDTKDFTINDIELSNIPNVPSKTGYNGKWETYILGAENIVIEALYEPITYTAYFYDGTNIIDTKTFTIEDNEINNTPVVPEKNGYNSKWEEYTIKSENITINAIYTPIEYKINYFLDNGTNNINNPTSYTIESNINLSSAKKQDYKFLGWYDNPEFNGNSISKVGNGKTGNLDLYAKFGSYEDDDGYFVISSEEDYLNYASNVTNYTKKAKLYSNIDLENYDVKPIGNILNPYMSEFDGNGFTIENVTINVTTENLSDYLFTKEDSISSYAHIGFFGNLYNATIKNITFKNLKLIVSDDVYDYVNEGLWADHKTTLKELTVGGVAACVENSTINANVSAIIDANSYGVYYEDKNTGRNFVGGVVGYANNTTISNLNEGSINVTITTDGKGKYSFIGGVAGGLYSSTVNSIDLTVSINSVSKSAYCIGGVTGYATNSNITNSNVIFTVKQLESERVVKDTYLSNKDILGTYNCVGGVASVIRANNSQHITTISNVNILSNVDMDCMFGGIVFRANSTDNSTNDSYVKLIDNTVNSTVNVLKAYGIGFYIPHTKIEYTNNYTPFTYNLVEYNILLRGDVTLSNGKNANEETEYSVAIISHNYTNSSVIFTFNQLKVLIENTLVNKCIISSTITSLYGGFSYL